MRQRLARVGVARPSKNGGSDGSDVLLEVYGVLYCQTVVCGAQFTALQVALRTRQLGGGKPHVGRG